MKKKTVQGRIVKLDILRGKGLPKGVYIISIWDEESERERARKRKRMRYKENAKGGEKGVRKCTKASSYRYCY